VLVHSDQRSQYSGVDYVAFFQANNLKPSMSRRGTPMTMLLQKNLFAICKKRVNQRAISSTRDAAKAETFSFIEMFCNPVKRHSHAGGVSPAKFEDAYFFRLEGG
tara:strand:+ start:1266 stop:1580 length:315 start_codon:yes stop_codon:yes gene_type:complete